MMINKKKVLGAVMVLTGFYFALNSGVFTGAVIGAKTGIVSSSFILGLIVGIIGAVLIAEKERTAGESGLEEKARDGMVIVRDEVQLGPSERPTPQVNPRAKLEKFRNYSRAHEGAVEIFDTSAIITYFRGGNIDEFSKQVGSFPKNVYIPHEVIFELERFKDEAYHSAKRVVDFQKKFNIDPMLIAPGVRFDSIEFVTYYEQAEDYLKKTDKAKAFAIVEEFTDKYAHGKPHKEVHLSSKEKDKLYMIKRYLSQEALEKLEKNYCRLGDLKTVRDFMKLEEAVKNNYRESKADAEVVGAALYLAKHRKYSYVYHRDKDISQAINFAGVADKDFKRYIHAERAE